MKIEAKLGDVTLTLERRAHDYLLTARDYTDALFKDVSYSNAKDAFKAFHDFCATEYAECLMSEYNDYTLRDYL